MKVIKLPKHCQIYLESIPEKGMGYHIMDVFLRKGIMLMNRTILNNTYLILEDNEKIETKDIFNIYK